MSDPPSPANDPARTPTTVRNVSNSIANSAPKSLFGEILDWMLAPLLLLWPISIAATNHVAHQIANQPYDQALASTVVSIVRLIKLEGNRVSINLPPATASSITPRSDEVDVFYYQVIDPKGKLLLGDNELRRVDAPAATDSDAIAYRDDWVLGEAVRVAYQFITIKPDAPPVLVQVAETRKKRDELSSRIISGVLLPQFAIIPLAVILVYLGLTRGIAPLSRLQNYIRRRRPADLSPIQIEPVPEEVRPLIVAFNEMMGRLEVNLHAQQRFIAQAAHQMRTPLTGLRLQTEIALEETDPQLMHAALERIAQSADRAAHLINQLLMLAQAEASHEKIHKAESVDLEELARAVTSDAAMAALTRTIDLGFEGPHWPLMIEGVPLLLRELISNLVDNAIKYTPRGGRVTVRVRALDRAVLEVEDNGIGIAEEERGRVFERFYRVLGAQASGSGLGLPIVAEIAELHRAQLELLTADNGRGCLFRVSFDRHDGPLAPLDLRPG